MRIDGNVAMITGASSGLGAEMARQLASRGWRVGLTARRAVELGEVAAAILADGGTVVIAPADATDAVATAAAVRKVVRQLGPIDLLIANAGIGLEFSARNFDASHFARMVQVNLVAPVLAIECVLPAMVERGSGQIVGISSLAGYRGLPGSAGYAATKAGLTALLEGLRPELKRSGIGVSIVHPGYVRTPMTSGQRHPQPFLMDVEPAVRRILWGIERRQRRIDFPLPMVALLRLARLLPDVVYDAITSRVLLGPPARPIKR